MYPIGSNGSAQAIVDAAYFAECLGLLRDRRLSSIEHALLPVVPGWGGEHQGELLGVVQRPVAELPAGGPHLLRQFTAGAAEFVVQLFGQVAADVVAQRAEQLFPGAVVAVQRGGGDAELAGDRPQGDRFPALRGQQGSRVLADLLFGGGAQSFASSDLHHWSLQ